MRADELRRENAVLRDRMDPFSSPILRISTSLDLDTMLAEVVKSARGPTGARHDQKQARARLQASPADPAVARGAVQGHGVPIEQGQPALAPHRDLAKPSPAHLAETEVMVGAHKGVPARNLVGPCQPHQHLAQPNLALHHSMRYGANRARLSSRPLRRS